MIPLFVEQVNNRVLRCVGDKFKDGNQIAGGPKNKARANCHAGVICVDGGRIDTDERIIYTHAQGEPVRQMPNPGWGRESVCGVAVKIFVTKTWEQVSKVLSRLNRVIKERSTNI